MTEQDIRKQEHLRKKRRIRYAQMASRQEKLEIDRIQRELREMERIGARRL
jgi:hypothetical protein